MRVLLVTLFSKLLIPTYGLGGGPDQSLIGRGRHTKVTGRGVHAIHPWNNPVKKMSLAASSAAKQPLPPLLPAKQLKMQDDSKATMGNLKQSSDTVESGHSLSSSNVVLELRIPTSLQRIQDSRSGPLSVFLDAVQRELCNIGNLSNDRLQLLGIRGEYTRVPPNQSSASILSESSQNRSMIPQSLHHNQVENTMTDQRVIIELEILPGSRTEATAEEIFTFWKKQLATPGSSLLQGPLRTVLGSATMQKEAQLNMNPRLVFNNAYQSSAVLRSVSWSLTLFCVFWGVA